jgi:hypothetical protein
MAMSIKHRWVVALLGLVVGCGDDAISSASDTQGSGSDSDSSGATTSTTGDPGTSSAASTSSGGATSTSSSSSSGESTTAATTDSTTTDAITTSSGPTGDPTGDPPCGPGAEGPDADDDTVPDACDLCPAGDDLSDADADGVPDACDLCLAGDDALDDDADGVPDACDACLDGDDALDADADGVPDACDACPLDNPDDPDADGICTADDICPKGDDDLDSDQDGLPDACDTEVVLDLGPAHTDYDVAGDGALVLVRDAKPNLYVTCYNGDRSLRRAEFIAATYTSNAGTAWPEIHIARQSQKVLLTWLEAGNGQPNSQIRYALLDDKCQPIVASATALAIPNGYGEMYDAAIDAVGNAVVAVSPSETQIVHLSADGAVKKAQAVAFNIGAVYGTHLAVNQATGEGVVAAQVHSGNGIYYRRFNADGSWKDNAAVHMSVDYHYWYDGFTVGMNDKSNFVFLWRPTGTLIKMRFYAADGSITANAQRTTIDFETWNGGHCYDSFRMRHQEIPLRGDNFILGEVYNWITPQQNRTVHHFEYTPDGQEIGAASTKVNLPEGLTIRADLSGAVYLSDHKDVHVLTEYP